MHKQRLAVVIAAGVGVLATFLPWARISFFGMSVSASGAQGFEGWLSLLMCAGAGALAFMGDYQKTPIESSKVKFVSLIGAAVTLLMFIELFFVIGLSVSSIGVYLALLAGICILAIPFVVKDNGDISMPNKQSITDEFNQMRND